MRARPRLSHLRCLINLPLGLTTLNLPSNTRAMDTTVVPYRITLRSGHPVLVRAVRPDDGPGLAEAYDQLSETSRYRRVFSLQTHPSLQNPAHLSAVAHPEPEAAAPGRPV